MKPKDLLQRLRQVVDTVADKPVTIEADDLRTLVTYAEKLQRDLFFVRANNLSLNAECEAMNEKLMGAPKRLAEAFVARAKDYDITGYEAGQQEAWDIAGDFRRGDFDAVIFGREE